MLPDLIISFTRLLKSDEKNVLGAEFCIKFRMKFSKLYLIRAACSSLRPSIFEKSILGKPDRGKDRVFSSAEPDSTSCSTDLESGGAYIVGSSAGETQ
jgi:hypothetical protein